MAFRSAVVVAALGLGVACGSPIPPAAPPALRVYSSNGVRALLDDLRPALERAAGRPVAFEFSTTTDLQQRIERGEVADIAVLTTAAIDALATRGLLASASRRPVAQVGVGVGVRAGAKAADVSTPEALKALLLGAGSVTYTAQGQSRPAIDQAFERLGIVDAMRGKTVLRGPAEPAGAVARGEAEVVLTLVSEMVAVPGLSLLGPLPAELQRHVTFVAARRDGVDHAAADHVLQALASVDARVLASYGLERAP